MQSLDEFWKVAITLIPTLAIALLFELRLFRDRMKKFPPLFRRFDAFFTAVLLSGLLWSMYACLMHLVGWRQSDTAAVLVVIFLGGTMIQVLVNAILFHLDVAFGGTVPLRIRVGNLRMRMYLLRLQHRTWRTRRLAAKRRRLVRFEIGQQRVRQLLVDEADAAETRDAYVREIEEWCTEREAWISKLDSGVVQMTANLEEMRSSVTSIAQAARMEAEARSLATLERKF